MDVKNDMSVICSDEEQFYGKARNYWSKVSPTINGVLGGFGYISECDIKGSKQFLEAIFEVIACIACLNFCRLSS